MPTLDLEAKPIIYILQERSASMANTDWM